MLEKNLFKYKEYESLRNGIKLPLKVKVFFSLLEETITGTKWCNFSKELRRKYTHVVQAFKKQTVEEKIDFLYHQAQALSHLLEKNSTNFYQLHPSNEIRQIETSCKVKDSFVGFTTWERRSFKFNRKTRSIRLSSKKNQISINLRHYYIRHSQKYPNALVLDSIIPQAVDKYSMFYFQFDNDLIVEQMYKNIFQSVVGCSVKQMMNKIVESDEEMEVHGCQLVSKNRAILNSKQINQYFKEKDKLITKLTENSYDFVEFEEKFPHVSINVDKKNKNIFKIEKIYKKNIKELEKCISLIHKTPDKHLLHFQNLQKFSNNIFLSYFKYLFSDEILQILAIIEEIRKDDEYSFVLKGINKFIPNECFDFLFLNITQVDSQNSLLSLLVFTSNQRKVKAKFLLQLINDSDHSIENIEEEFWTVRSSPDSMSEPEIDQTNIQLNLSSLGNHGVYQLQKSEIWVSKYRSNEARYQVSPHFPLQNHDRLTQHFLFNEWKVSKNGGVICTNETIIEEQKKVFKLILSRMGSNFFKHKSIMNFSLPVNVFRKESHLKTLARNFSYAPLLLDEYTNAPLIKRMQKTILLQISINTLGISLQKPFNPIIGETYQGSIDGCPIFFQQISHHPPISAYYFAGRGYKIHGTIQTKVSLGLNCAKGTTPSVNFIQFDDGVKFQFSIAMVVINGLLFGERSYNFEGKNYIIDRQHKIVAEMNYGSSQGFFSKAKDPYDSVKGQIVDVDETDNIKEAVRKGKKLLDFSGLWHSQVEFNNKKAIDFRVDLPSRLRDCDFPLRSDSSYRTDLRSLIEGDLEKAQEEKNLMEQEQRKDRKLRELHKNMKN